MKRSDMLELIEDVISFKHNRLRDICDEVSADEILSAIEKAGMLPPSTNLSHISAVDNAWEPETCGSCEIPCNNDWCCTKDNDE